MTTITVIKGRSQFLILKKLVREVAALHIAKETARDALVYSTGNLPLESGVVSVVASAG